MSRLTVEDKKRFVTGLTRNLGRMEETIPYPLEHLSAEELLEFVQHDINDEVLKAVDVLKTWGQSNINSILNYRVSITPVDVTGESIGHVRAEVTRPVLTSTRQVCERGEPVLYRALCDYLLYRKYAERLCQQAASWVERAVNSCTSVGQLKRALPDFAPLYSDWMRQQLAQAQRASRMPKDFPHNIQYQTLALNAITAVSLLPLERKEMPYVSLSHHGGLAMRRMMDNQVRVFSWQPDDSIGV